MRVYYEDTDAGGIVYHASYLRFLERGRTEFIRTLSLDQSQLMQSDNGRGVLFVVRRMALDFIAPARLDDTLTIVTETADLGGASFTVGQMILCGGRRLLTADVTIAVIDAQGKLRRLPPEIRAKFTSSDAI